MNNVNMVSFERLISVSCRIGRDFNGQSFANFSTYVSCRDNEILILWKGEHVLRIYNFQERRRVDRDGFETTYSVQFSTYVGWKLYMRLTGCFASQPKNEALLSQGVNAEV